MIEFTPLPFDEAIRFFGDKVTLAPDKYRALTAEARAKAFTVAGVAKMDVLTDLYTGIDKAISEGTTFADFQKSVTGIMEKRGWTGMTPYRLDNVFRTNIQQAYQAGHFQKQMGLADRRPYWQYVAVMDSRTRPAHARMNGKVMRYDDPFWETSYPPNGFRCRCAVRDLSESEFGREKLNLTENQDSVADPGFDTNPGEAYRVDLVAWEKAEKAPRPLQEAFMDAMAKGSPRRAAFADWVDEIAKDRKARGKTSVIGWMDSDTMNYLTRNDVHLSSPVITANDKRILHTMREAKEARGSTLSIEETKGIPDVIAGYDAVLWDTEDPALVYVSAGRERDIKIVVRVNYRLKGEREPVNLLTTAGKVQRKNLTTKRYQLIRGEL